MRTPGIFELIGKIKVAFWNGRMGKKWLIGWVN
jgi:hypothetical protein